MGAAHRRVARAYDWDGAWYLRITEKGYEFRPGEESSVGFFPFYPLLVRIAGLGTFDLKLTGVILPNVFFIAAAVLLYRIVMLERNDERLGRLAVTFLMFSPVSFFFSSMYTESTFLLLSIGAFYAAVRQKWFAACLCGMALSATRNAGLLIALPLFVEFVRQRWALRRHITTLLTPALLYFALIPLGLGAFMLFARAKFHDPFAYNRATAVWGRKLVAPWVTFYSSEWIGPFYLWIYCALLAFAVVLCIAAVYSRLRLSYQVWAGILIALYICSNSLEAIPRLLSVVFPLYIVLAIVSARWPRLFEPLFAGSVALLAICTVLSANGYWMT